MDDLVSPELQQIERDAGGGGGGGATNATVTTEEGENNTWKPSSGKVSLDWSHIAQLQVLRLVCTLQQYSSIDVFRKGISISVSHFKETNKVTHSPF